MDRPSLAKINNTLLRGGMCAVWASACVIGFFEFLFYATEYLQPDQNMYLWRFFGCMGVAIVGAAAHVYLRAQDVKTD